MPFNGDAALTVTNASAPDGRLVLITFQLATDPSFATPIATETIPQAPGAHTTCHIEASLSGSPVGTTLYWRARPGSSESIGAWTAPMRLTIGERQDAPDVLFAEPPTLLSPADGSLQNRQPALVARAGSHSSGPTELRFYLSTTPSFSATPKCQTWLGNYGVEGRCQLSRLAPGTYYWRVETTTTRAGSSQANGVRSAPSATRSFRVEAGDIQPPQFEAPVSGALEHPRPTIRIANSTRSGTVGPLSYRFDVAPDTLFASSSAAISATVPEGAGSTSWTLPADLMVGVPYEVRVTAVDAANGFESEPSEGRYFTVVSRSNTLLTLTLETRCSTADIPAASTMPIGSLPFVATTADTMAIRLDALSPTGQMTGVIEGKVSRPSQKLIGNSSGTLPLSTIATVGPAGELTGTFDGSVFHATSTYPAECAGTGYRWTLRRR
ncbi:MAG: hypothetical protein KA205_02140 [Acidobacteria bacterium]|nr:hypothetical protein [Acidobacteriota bacterium]